MFNRHFTYAYFNKHFTYGYNTLPKSIKYSKSDLYAAFILHAEKQLEEDTTLG
jgi:hypothetical protein